MNLEFLCSLPKSLYLNVKLFGIKGLRIPVLVKYDVSVKEIARDTICLTDYRFASVKIGFGGIDSVPSQKSKIILKSGSKLIFDGRAQFSAGIYLKNKGEVVFGDRFATNKNLRLSCSERIEFGNNCLLGWNICIRDSDGHTVMPISMGGDKCADYKSVTTKPVVVGNHVWIASECHILKGVVILDDCVIGYKSLVLGNFQETNCIIAGHPANVVRKGVTWKF